MGPQQSQISGIESSFFFGRLALPMMCVVAFTNYYKESANRIKSSSNTLWGYVVVQKELYTTPLNISCCVELQIKELVLAHFL